MSQIDAVSRRSPLSTWAPRRRRRRRRRPLCCLLREEGVLLQNPWVISGIQMSKLTSHMKAKSTPMSNQTSFLSSFTILFRQFRRNGGGGDDVVNNDEFLFDSQVFFENLDMLIRPPFLVIMSLSQISQCLTSFFSLATTSFVFR